MGASRRSDVAIVATELATNLVRYAQRGRVLLQTITSPAVSHSKSSPSIQDRGSPTCIGACRTASRRAERRATAWVRCAGCPTSSTSIQCRRKAPSSCLAFAKTSLDHGGASRFSTGAVSIPAPHEVVCGDAWRVIEQGGELAVMVADGLGHGPQAADAADRAADTFGRDPFGDAALFFERANRDLIGSRGAAVACARDWCQRSRVATPASATSLDGCSARARAAGCPRKMAPSACR